MLPAELTILLTNFVQWLVITSLKTIPLIIFVLLTQRFFRKFLAASANYFLWFTVLMSLCVPFGWQLKVAPVAINTYLAKSENPNLLEADKNTYASLQRSDAASQNTKSISSTLQDSFDKRTGDSNMSIKPVSTITGAYVIAIIWLVGAIAFLFLIIARAYQFHRIKINAEPANDETFEMLRLCKADMRVNKSIQLLGTSEIQSPVTLGWLKPAIILPKGLEHQLSPTKLKHILLHEIGHIKRHDIFFNWIICLVNVLHWFNPAVWLACRYMRRDMEIACDALVLSHLDKTQRKSYGTTLIEISEIPRVSPKVQTALGMFESHNELKQRLNRIKDFTTMNIKNSIFFGVILTATAITSLAQPNTANNGKTSAATIGTVSDIKSEDTELRNFAKFAEKELDMKVLVGQNYAKTAVQVNMGERLDYGKFLTQLKINEFTAYKSKDYIQIIPLRDARSFSIPVVEKGKTYYEDEVVTDYLTTDKSCAAQVLATVRPLVPQYAHLSSDNGHTLVIIDTFGNIQRIRSAIKTLEANLDAPVDCKSIVPQEFRPNPPKQVDRK